MQKANMTLSEDLLSTDVASIVSATLPVDIFKGNTISSVCAEVVKSNPLNTQTSSRITLIRDAAHKTTTHAGQGATAAVKDEMILSNRIKNVPSITETRSQMN
jgi:hypothetical protein